MKDVWMNSSSVVHVYAQNKKTQQAVRKQFTFIFIVHHLRLIYPFYSTGAESLSSVPAVLKTRANFFVLIQGIDALYASQQGVKSLW